ncbi:hypothetical protein ANCCAN_08787, partial [Ancylostoma caninum]
LGRFGGKGLVFDDTFHVTRYSFRLATLVVANDGGRGYPCCFLISYRMTSEEVAYLYELVKKVIPHFDTRFAMTDDTYVFFNAFMKVFPDSRAQKVLCSFHSTDVDLGKKLLGDLFRQSNPTRFERMYAAFITWLTSKEATKMVQAFRCLNDGYRRRTLTLRRHRTAVKEYSERQGLIIELGDHTWGWSQSHGKRCFTQYMLVRFVVVRRR